VTLNVLIQSTPVSLNFELLMQSPPIGSADINKQGWREVHTALLFDSFSEPTVAFIPVASPSHPASWLAPVRLEKPSMALVTQHVVRSWAIYLSAVNSSANDNREHILFRVVSESDKDGSGSSVKPPRHPGR
jgi:hypothetical protein